MLFYIYQKDHYIKIRQSNTEGNKQKNEIFNDAAKFSWWYKVGSLDATVKEKLYNVTTYNKNNSILEASEYDPVIRAHLSGVSHLMAA